MNRKKIIATAITSLLLTGTLISPVSIHAENSGAQQKMYRLYNPNSGEHFYTANTKERDHLDQIGWNYEGIGWIAPEKSNTPVYRLYNANGGEHHYTMNAKERDGLVKAGWKYEGIGWYSDDNKSVPLLREYNPNKYSCNHNYTTSEKEHNHLVSIGWRDEGQAWYAISAGTSNTASTGNPSSGADTSNPDQKVQIGTKTIVDKEAWDETVVDKAAWDETVVDQPAYDEYVENGEVLVDNLCGARFYSKDYVDQYGYDKSGLGAMKAFKEHSLHESGPGAGSYHVEPYYDIIHHDAVTHVVHHDAETHIVHHPAVTHEEPVYQ